MANPGANLPYDIRSDEATPSDALTTMDHSSMQVLADEHPNALLERPDTSEPFPTASIAPERSSIHSSRSSNRLSDQHADSAAADAAPGTHA